MQLLKPFYKNIGFLNVKDNTGKKDQLNVKNYYTIGNTLVTFLHLSNPTTENKNWINNKNIIKTAEIMINEVVNKPNHSIGTSLFLSKKITFRTLPTTHDLTDEPLF